MLTKFSVENFKNFRDKMVFDLSLPCNYEFNKEVIIENHITKGIILGQNGSGKSNLGLALFDIVIHLTDKEKLLVKYNNYLNMESAKSQAFFEYEFMFNSVPVVYKYSKISAQILTLEQLIIGNKEVIYYDFIKKEGFTRLAGSETLNLINSESIMSRIKYVRSNSMLEDNEENRIFLAFLDFVDRMLLFYSLDKRGYMGFQLGGESIAQGIVDRGELKNFEEFLRKFGIDYHLTEKELDDTKQIYVEYGKKDVNFFSIASTGTTSLALFYYWYTRMKEASFVFMDEFDAFYHFELAEGIVELVKKLQNTQVFLTSHNTDLISNDLLRPDCYFEIKNGEIKTLADLTQRELRKAHNLQKMYKAGVFHEERSL